MSTPPSVPLGFVNMIGLKQSPRVYPWATVLGLLLCCAPSFVSARDALEAQPVQQDAAESVEPAVERPSAPVEEITDLTPAQWQEEYQQLNKLIQRFEVEVMSFESDVQRSIDDKYVEELARHQRNYDALLDKLEDEVTVRRKEAITRYEQFIQKYPDSAHTAIAMVRLAELYYEEAEFDFILADMEYEEQFEQFQKGQRSELPPEPRVDYSRSLSLYEQVVRNFPGYKDIDGVYYMKGFILGRENSTTFDAEAGKDAFVALIARNPDSSYAFQAYLLIGDFFFERNDLNASVEYYQKAMSYRSKKWDRALYKLAWAQYRLGVWDEAVASFVQLLDFSEQLKIQEEKESDLRPEAVQYLAISLADSGSFADAVSRFEAIGGREYQLEILTTLAEVYAKLARFDEAIDAYKQLQALYPDNPDNPAFESEIAKIYVQLPYGADLDSAIESQKRLVALYGAETGWNQSMNDDLNKKALGHAETLVREALRDIAVHYHSQATQNDELTAEQARRYFDDAAEYYRQYLEQFPFSEEAYELQYYLADCLYFSGRMEEASQEFKKALTYTDTEYHSNAARGVVDSYAQLIDQTGSEEGVLKPVTREEGSTSAVPIDELLKSYIEAVDTYARVDRESETTPRLMLKAGLVNYFHYDFKEARRRFEEVVLLFPKDASAPQATQYIVNSYDMEDNWEEVIASAERFVALDLGDNPAEWRAVQGTLSEFKSTATFKRAQGILNLDTKDLEIAASSNGKAGEAFLDYADKFPDTEYTADSLAYAAIAFEQAGDTDKAIEVNTRLIAEHPDSRFVEGAYYSIASNYEKAFEFEKAIKYHQELATKFPSSTNAATSLFNASYLTVAMKDYREAARGFERYVRLYPQQGDSESVLFLAAETYEKSLDWSQAVRVYREYLQRFPRINGDRVMLAYTRIIEDLNKLERGREALEVERALTGVFESLKEQQLMTLKGLNLYASVAFREVERQYQAFESIRLQGSERQMARQFERKQTSLDEFKGTVATLAALGDIEHRLAGFYTLGMAFQTFARHVEEVPCPAGFDEFECEIYMEELREAFVYDANDQATGIFERVLDEANESGVNNRWVDKAYDQLTILQKDSYPIRKPERLDMVPADRDFALPAIEAKADDDSRARL